MGKAGGIIAIIAGLLGIVAAAFTLLVGGVGSVFQIADAQQVVGLGWGGFAASVLVIVFGAIATAAPKSAGLALIVISILGALFGGTFVALAMVLSFIGGVVALFGRGAASAVGQTDAVITATKALITLTAISVVVFAIYDTLKTQAPEEASAAAPQAESVRRSADPLTELTEAEPSRLAADGELAELFVFGSNRTDLQRENKFNEIEGQVVEWHLPVYDISSYGDGYKVQTRTGAKNASGRTVIGTFVYIHPRTAQDRRLIEALNTDDVISFKGRIAGLTSHWLEISPAILIGPEASVIAKLIGQEADAVLGVPSLRPHFRALLGDDLYAFQYSMTLSANLVEIDGWYVGLGCMSPPCINQAVFAIHKHTGHIAAARLATGPDGRGVYLYGAETVEQLPPPLVTWYRQEAGS